MASVDYQNLGPIKKGQSERDQKVEFLISQGYKGFEARAMVDYDEQVAHIMQMQGIRDIQVCMKALLDSVHPGFKR